MANFFCGEFYIQSWTVDGAQIRRSRCCVNVDHINAVEPYVVDNELHLVFSFQWQTDDSLSFTLKGEDAKRFLNAYRVTVPLDWLVTRHGGSQGTLAATN